MEQKHPPPPGIQPNEPPPKKMCMGNEEQDIMRLFMDLGRGIIGSNNQGNEIGPSENRIFHQNLAADL
eukprot:10987998-Ditylum_brightwellii.AAC.1